MKLPELPWIDVCPPHGDDISQILLILIYVMIMSILW